MYDIVDKLVNRYSETDALISIMENEEYGGTYDRPWNLHNYRLLNDRGETVQHGRYVRMALTPSLFL